MRCKKHPADLSSGVGVCATCLRHRLFAVMEAQAQAQLQRDCRISDAQQPAPLAFPRSVSPYISRRKADAAAAEWNHRSLYTTPHLGHTAASLPVGDKKRNGGGRFSALFLGLFRSKSDKRDFDSDPGVLVESCSASPSWFSNMFPRCRNKQIRSFSVDSSSIGARRRSRRNHDRGMSPARYSDEEEDEHCHGGSSGYSSESSPGWKQTPRRTPAAVRLAGGRGTGLSRNVSGLAFCLSPLVRASPNRHWNQKGVAPEAVLVGESRVPAKSRLATATSFCKNRSRKLADFGRYNSRR